MKLKRYLKYTTLVVFVCLFLATLPVLLGIYNNNKNITPLPRDTLEESFSASVDWLINNKSKLVKNHNTALWWMIKEASLISDNKQLEQFYKNYKRSYLDLTPNNVWTPYFDDNYTPIISDIDELYYLNEYQLFFVYSMSCDAKLAKQAVIQKQLKPDYCVNHFLHPRCVTHQQMAVHFIKKKNCDDVAKLSDQLLDIIEQEITLDFRVTDSYLQRALMLTDSGRTIKPIWLSKIIDAQKNDGGWADFYTIIKISSFDIGTSSTRPMFGPKQSNFHATAQAIWLLAMLLDKPTGT